MKKQSYWFVWSVLSFVGAEIGAAEIQLGPSYGVSFDASDAEVTVSIRKAANYVSMGLTLASADKTVDKREAEIVAGRKALLERSGAVAGIQVVELPVGRQYRSYAKTSKLSSLSFGGSSHSSEPGLSQASFEVRAQLTEGVELLEVVRRIREFVDSLKLPSKSSKMLGDSVSLGVDEPERYRGELLKRIAADVRFVQEQLGQGGEVTIIGLERPVRWRRVSVRELELFISYSLVFELEERE
tara:strand:+ start:742 stop:1467 length:726 start_codon:yes stop_codon:yes gene_type:complete